MLGIAESVRNLCLYCRQFNTLAERFSREWKGNSLIIKGDFVAWTYNVRVSSLLPQINRPCSGVIY